MNEGKVTVGRVNEETADTPLPKETFERLATGSVGVVNLHRTLANSPTAFARFIDFAHALRFATALEPCPRELAILRVLAIHRGEYEAKHHRTMALAAGASEAQADGAVANAIDPALYDPTQLAVLRFADAFARAKGVPDDVSAALKEHLDDRRVVELSLTLTLYVGLAHFTHAVDVPVDSR